MAGVDLDFSPPLELPCAECGGMVDLTSPIKVAVTNQDGTETETEMTEANARIFLMQVGITPPIVMCDRHVDLEW